MMKQAIKDKRIKKWRMKEAKINLKTIKKKEKMKKMKENTEKWK